VETKPVVKDSLSALLTNGGDSAATKKNNLCLIDKIITRRWTCFRSFLTERHSNSKRLKDKKLEILSADSVMKFLWGKLTNKRAK
jgi:SecD/SecF fusion protein